MGNMNAQNYMIRHLQPGFEREEIVRRNKV